MYDYGIHFDPHRDIKLGLLSLYFLKVYSIYIIFILPIIIFGNFMDTVAYVKLYWILLNYVSLFTWTPLFY